MLINVNLEEVIEDLTENQCKEMYEEILNKVGRIIEIKWTEESYKFYGLEDEDVFNSIRGLVSELSKDQLEVIISDNSEVLSNE